MLTNDYLYGEGVEVPNIPEDIVMRKLELLNDHLTELLVVPLLERDGPRVNAVIKAIKFWRGINGSTDL